MSIARKCSFVGIAAVLFLSAGGAVTAGEKAPEPLFRTEVLADGVFAIQGPGGTVTLVETSEGALLVDASVSQLADRLLETVRTLTKSPIRWLVNTHLHPDHVGGNARIEKEGAKIIAHASVRKRLLAQQAKLPPADRGGLPTLLLGEENGNAKARLTLWLGGVEILLDHAGAGHTDGDVVLWLPGKKVLIMGDLLFSRILPFLDTEAGSTLPGYIRNVQAAIALASPDARVVPGHGPLTDLAGLRRSVEFLQAAEAHVKAHPKTTPAKLAESFDRSKWKEIEQMEGFVSWESFFRGASGQGLGRVDEK
jgi:glyoxylase-like metal-dependent hydrolase (beta-lactamase superfamily II)